MKKDFDEEDEQSTFLIETIAGSVILIVLVIIAAIMLYRSSRNDKAGLTDTSIEEVVSSEVAQAETEATGEYETEANTGTEETDTTDEDLAVNLAGSNRKELPIGELPQEYTPGKLLSYDDADGQLKELFGYWNEYQIEAVWDIIHLPRLRKITTQLKDSNDYYYYGELNEEGKPNGRGLAVYANDTYYCGDFKDGLRDGSGMWVRLFIDKTGIANGVSGVKEHQYNGAWEKDYPCGDGQETFVYDNPKTENDYIIRNAIGGFKDGFYNGDMYIITQDKNNAERTVDWYGSAEMGSFTFLNNKKSKLGKRAIWKIGDGFDTDEEDGCRWIMPVDNMDFGIAGLKKSSR